MRRETFAFIADLLIALIRLAVGTFILFSAVIGAPTAAAILWELFQ